MSTDSADDGGLPPVSTATVEFLLFDSLVHHLIEKGLLTKNDALSVVQTAAEVVRGKIHEMSGVARIDTALSTLQRTYASFEALPDRYGRRPLDADKVTPLRAPLHRERPHFPSDDD